MYTLNKSRGATNLVISPLGLRTQRENSPPHPHYSSPRPPAQQIDHQSRCCRLSVVPLALGPSSALSCRCVLQDSVPTNRAITVDEVVPYSFLQAWITLWGCLIPRVPTQANQTLPDLSNQRAEQIAMGLSKLL